MAAYKKNNPKDNDAEHVSDHDKSVSKKAEPAAKKKKEVDPNAPKAPLTTFMQFTNDHRDKLKAENPTLSNPEISKVLGQKWKEIDPEIKQKYVKDYEEKKKKYGTDLAAYKEGNYNPVQNDENHEPTRDTSNVLDSSSKEKKKKKDKKRPRSPTPEKANSSPIKESKRK